MASPSSDMQRQGPRGLAICREHRGTSRHTPDLSNVLARRTAHFDAMALEMCPAGLEVPAHHSAEVFALFSRPMTKLKQALALDLPLTSCFSGKVNGATRHKAPLMKSP